MSPSWCLWFAGRGRRKNNRFNNDVTQVSFPTTTEQRRSSRSSQPLYGAAKPLGAGTSASPQGPDSSGEIASPPPRQQLDDKSLSSDDLAEELDGLERTTSRSNPLSSPINQSLSTGNPDDTKSNNLKPIEDIWSEAYDTLKTEEATKDLMETYEKILSSEKLQRLMAGHSNIDIGTTP